MRLTPAQKDHIQYSVLFESSKKGIQANIDSCKSLKGFKVTYFKLNKVILKKKLKSGAFHTVTIDINQVTATEEII